MANVKVRNTKGEEVGELELGEAVFYAEIKPHLHWEVVRNQLANRRQGTHATKTRSQVKGTGAKAYRQKGTGRARHGNRKSNLFRGGGTAHGPHPRDYSYKVPKKVSRAALCSALSARVGGGDLVVLDNWSPEQPKTRDAAAVLGTLGLKNALVVAATQNDNLDLSLRNLPDIKYIRVEGVNVFDVLKHDKLVLTVDAARALEQRLGQ